MKHIQTACIIAALTLPACGEKRNAGEPHNLQGLNAPKAANDLNAEDAATALNAMFEVRNRFAERPEQATSITCPEGGQVQGITRTEEDKRKNLGQEYTRRLVACQSHGIIADGIIVYESRPGGAGDYSYRYNGAVTFRGDINGSCEVHLADNARETPEEEKQHTSTFCGHDYKTLIEVMMAPPPPPAPAEVEEQAANDEVTVTETETAEEPDEEASLEEVPDEEVPDTEAQKAR